MAKEIPIIEITQEFDHDDEMSDSECTSDRRLSLKEALTDIEDLDSDENSTPKSNLLMSKRKTGARRISDTATDLEDFDDDADSDFEEIESIDEHFSLAEFLDQGIINESSAAGKSNQSKQNRRKSSAVSLNVECDEQQALTDCEDYETDENIDVIECDEAETEKYNSILMQMDDFGASNITDATISKSNKRQWRERSSRQVELSDSDEEAQSRHDKSDVENILFSDDEIDHNQPHCSRMKHSKSAIDAEEIVLAASDADEPTTSERRCSHPSLDIRFKCKSDGCSQRRRKVKTAPKSCGNALAVNQTTDDLLTDVENLDSSDDDGCNIRCKSQIPIAYVIDEDEQLALTDDEDFEIDGNFLTRNVADIKLPSPVREIKLIKEDPKGDPISKSMPLVSGTQLGLEQEYIDRGLTDTEDLSGNEDDIIIESCLETPMIIHLNEGFVTENERLRKGSMIEGDPVTDVEDISNVSKQQFRRKKNKPKSRSLLNVGDAGDQGVTDTEELYVSDDQVRHLHLNRPRNFDDDGKTDTEYLSNDDGIEIEDVTPDIDENILCANVFESNVVSSENSTVDGSKQRFSEISSIIRTRENIQAVEATLTDIEDMNIQSDADDLLDVDQTYSRANTATPMELRSAFCEGNSFSVHDQSRHAFDATIEANHIKGYGDINDSHTDVELMDDEQSKMCT